MENNALYLICKNTIIKLILLEYKEILKKKISFHALILPIYSGYMLYSYYLIYAGILYFRFKKTYDYILNRLILCFKSNVLVVHLFNGSYKYKSLFLVLKEH